MKYILYILLLTTNICLSQDTILVNENFKTSLVFDLEPVDISISEKSNFFLIEEPVVKNEKYFLSLKADKEFKDLENLDIYFSNNKLKSFKVKYQKKKFTPYFSLNIAENKQAEKVFSASENKKSIQKNEVDTIYRNDAKRINSSLKRDWKRPKTKINGLTIHLVNTYARNGKLFLRFEFTNETNYPFTTDEINFKITENESWNKKSSPEQIINPIYVFEEEKLHLKPNEKIYKTFVFDALKLEQNKSFVIYFEEENASKYFLELRADIYINKPTVFSYAEKK